jgi:hypothetical protein
MQVYQGIVVRTARMIGRLHEGLALGNWGRFTLGPLQSFVEACQQLRSAAYAKLIAARSKWTGFTWATSCHHFAFSMKLGLQVSFWLSQSESSFSAPNYRGEGPKLEKWARDEDPPSEDEGEFLRITRLERCIRIYSIIKEYINSDSKIYNFRPPWPYLLLLILLPLLLPILLPLLLPISSAFALTTKISYSFIKF